MMPGILYQRMRVYVFYDVRAFGIMVRPGANQNSDRLFLCDYPIAG